MVLALLCLAPHLLHAAEEPNPAPDFIQARVRAFNLTVDQRSDSGRLYLFHTAQPEELPVGKILLLKIQDEKIMAIRTLRTFPDQTTFIGKRAKKYRENFLLESGEQLTAYMKVGESKIPSASTREKKELRQFEDEIKIDLDVPPEERFQHMPPAQPHDPELDDRRGNPLPPEEPPSPQEEARAAPPPARETTRKERPSPSSMDEMEDIDEELEIIEERSYAEPERHWITAQVGLARNRKFDLTTATYSGAGFKYGLSLRPPFVIEGPKVQDSIGLEFGTFFYNVNAFETDTDSYTLCALSFTARYNIFVSETMTPFFYLGILRNSILSSTESSIEGEEALSSSLPAIGTGFFFTVGPKWKLRVDLGYDLLALGITLRL